MPVINEIRSNLQGVVAIYLFGSFGSERQNAKSDIDLAFLSKDKFTKERCWHVAQKIAVKMQRDVDLVDLKAANTVLNFQILNEGKRIWVAEEERLFADNYETSLFGQYQHLQAERQEVVDQFVHNIKGK